MGPNVVVKFGKIPCRQIPDWHGCGRDWLREAKTCMAYAIVRPGELIRIDSMRCSDDRSGISVDHPPAVHRMLKSMLLGGIRSTLFILLQGLMRASCGVHSRYIDISNLATIDQPRPSESIPRTTLQPQYSYIEVLEKANIKGQPERI